MLGRLKANEGQNQIFCPRGIRWDGAKGQGRLCEVGPELSVGPQEPPSVGAAWAGRSSVQC